MGDVDDPLSPEALTRTLGHLVVAEAMVIDAILGRSVTEKSAAAVRAALASARRVAVALDQDRQRGDDPPPDPEPEEPVAPVGSGG